jgi:pyridoxine/pyridoxamine 5'-phosphate oxidase
VRVNEEAVTLGREIVDAGVYMTLATADASGSPWASPVWFAHRGYSEFVWISKPDARHSRNIAERPEVAIAIFDSRVPPGTGRGVYLRADAHQLEGDELAAGIEVFNGRVRSDEPGARAIDAADVAEPAQHRLDRATVLQTWVLDEHDERVPVTL